MVEKSLWLSLGVVGLVACASGGDGGGTKVMDESRASAAGTSLPCDVDSVLANNCRGCHAATPQFGAPMSLVSHADVVAPAPRTAGKKVFEVMGTRIHDDARPMPPPPHERLSTEERATIDRWIAAGAPAGDQTCTTTRPEDPAVKPLDCEADQKIRPASKHKVTDEPDHYVCYGFDTTATAKRHVIAGAPRVDNTKVVHHILLFQTPRGVNRTPHTCSAGGGANWRLVTGWAPGGKNFELPPEAGFAEETGTTHWAIQIHYNNAQKLQNEVDETGYDLCSTDKLRPNDADILATGTVDIDIPARSTHTTTCEVTHPAAFGTIHVVSAWAHMHKLGAAQYARRVRNGQETSLLEAPNYDFFVGAGANEVNVEIKPGDKVRTMCQWKNPGTGNVTFGEATGDEMCYAFLTYWPKVRDPRFNWMVPAAPGISQCESRSE